MEHDGLFRRNDNHRLDNRVSHSLFGGAKGREPDIETQVLKTKYRTCGKVIQEIRSVDGPISQHSASAYAF